ncbi:LOW QUALITY PROTEIN: carbohydrate sulfotransferase 13-like [Amphiura filiformis]|uniref:LOW QUALITY PROTEIN: carbohydrate sulfotransferase 13-like n=1 Tax=Amphiura filiformis TaxID=82378 RepID=UPI003B21159C
MKLGYRCFPLFLAIILFILSVGLRLLSVQFAPDLSFVFASVEGGVAGTDEYTGHRVSSVKKSKTINSTNSYIDESPCADECEWLQEQQRRRRTVENACEHYTPQRIMKDILSYILVSDAYNVLYCYIPKVACSNWKSAMLLLNGKNGAHPHKTFIPSLKTFSDEEVERRLRDYTKFIIVRNPHERLLSAYIEKFVKESSFTLPVQRKFGPIIHRNNVKYLTKKYANATGNVKKRIHLMKDASKVSFQEFIRYVGDPDPDNKLDNPHWREMYRLCSPCSIQYDFIGKLDTITEDSKFILSHIGATNLTSIVQAKPHHATNSSSAGKVQKAYEEVTEEDVLQFEKRFEKGMALFGYQRPTSITGFKSEDDDRKDALRELSRNKNKV